MGSDITRRDFLNGASVIIGTSFLPSSGVAASPGAQDGPGYYPPELSGMRGSHVGSFETAHEAVSGKKWRAHDSGEQYDLIVIGEYISGQIGASVGSETYVLFAYCVADLFLAIGAFYAIWMLKVSGIVAAYGRNHTYVLEARPCHNPADVR